MIASYLGTSHTICEVVYEVKNKWIILLKSLFIWLIYLF